MSEGSPEGSNLDALDADRNKAAVSTAAALNLAMAVQEARPAPMAHPQPTPAAAAAFHRSLADIMPASVMLPHFPFSYYATQERLKNCHTSLLAAGAAAAAAAVSSASPSLFTIDSILAPRPLLAHRPPPAYLPFPALPPHHEFLAGQYLCVVCICMLYVVCVCCV